MKTLIVGATGHLGQEMVKACKNQGNEVHALVRRSTRDDSAKMKPLEAIGAIIHEGDLKDYSTLVNACQNVDSVLSVIGSFQIGDEQPLIKAVKEADVKRFIPSDFGLDPAAAGPGWCALFDAKSAIHMSIKESGIPYTFVHTGGFFTYWVFSLGDLTKLGGKLPPAEVNVYGDGNVRGSFVSVSDIAAVTLRALNDPNMENKEVRIAANTLTQNELIDSWQKKSGKLVKKVRVPAGDLEKIIAYSSAPDQGMTLVLMQLHRSMWIRGDFVKRAAMSLEAADLYPDFKFQTIDEGLAKLV